MRIKYIDIDFSAHSLTKDPPLVYLVGDLLLDFVLACLVRVRAPSQASTKSNKRSPIDTHTQMIVDINRSKEQQRLSSK